MSFAHLSPLRIQGIRQAFNDGGYIYDAETRSIFMELVDVEYQSTLGIFPVPSRQLSIDLRRLNGVPKFKEQIPIKQWLQKGLEEIFSGTPQAPYFEVAIQDVDKGPYTADQTDTIVDGLEALSDLVQTDQNAFRAVIYYQETFKNALREMEVIAQYKSLHDDLHQVQLSWPHATSVDGALTRQEFDQLFNPANALKERVENLQKTYDRGNVDRTEISWIEELRKDQSQLEDALFAEDVDKIKLAFAAVAGLLMRELSRLNGRLKVALNNLQLKTLIKAMSDVCDSIDQLSPDNAPAQIEQYKTGIAEFRNMDVSLEQLIDQHDTWQRIHDTLHTFRDALQKTLSGEDATTKQGQERALSVLLAIKITIQATVTPLLEGKTTQGARRLQTTARKLSDEIDRSEVKNAAQAFDTYTQLAWHRFFEIDDEMKKASESLRVIGDNLRKVNDQLKLSDEWD